MGDGLSERVDTALEVAELVYSGDQVGRAVAEMAGRISSRIADSHPVIMCVMMGGLIPTARLIAHFRFPYELDYLHATRYRGGVHGGDLEWLAHPRKELTGRTVLIVDDILDQGATLTAVAADCRDRGASEVLSAVLVVKRHNRRPEHVVADFAALEVEDRYVFGSGMDFLEHHRGLPGIYALDES